MTRTRSTARKTTRLPRMRQLARRTPFPTEDIPESSHAVFEQERPEYLLSPIPEEEEPETDTSDRSSEEEEEEVPESPADSERAAPTSEDDVVDIEVDTSTLPAPTTEGPDTLTRQEIDEVLDEVRELYESLKEKIEEQETALAASAEREEAALRSVGQHEERYATLEQERDLKQEEVVELLAQVSNSDLVREELATELDIALQDRDSATTARDYWRSTAMHRGVENDTLRRELEAARQELRFRDRERRMMEAHMQDLRDLAHGRSDRRPREHHGEGCSRRRHR